MPRRFTHQNGSPIPNPHSPGAAIVREIHERGPLTVAAFMDLALYHPELGYYARAAQRSGRAGDFFTSVDVGPLFGELCAAQFAEMFEILSAPTALSAAHTADSALAASTETRIANPESLLDLVEAGAGNGRLSADVLRAARDSHPAFYERVRLHLVEASSVARAAHRQVLGPSADRLVSSSAELPRSFNGVLFANELLDAMPVHEVVVCEDGLREVYVVARPFKGRDQRLEAVEGPPSTPALAAYLEAAGVELPVGARAEINLAAVEWVRSAARCLGRGFIVLIDYGHEASELYSATHAAGTLTSFARHIGAGSEVGTPAWLASPGEQDITAHVDFSSIRAAAEAEGCRTLGFMDQTYFLMGILVGSMASAGSTVSRGLSDPRTARALKTLIMPGGLGSTQKVLILGKGVAVNLALRCCSYRMRVT